MKQHKSVEFTFTKKRGSNEREFTNRRQPGGECGKRALLTYAYFIRQRKQTWSAITIEKKPMHKQSFWLRHYLSEDVVRNKPNRIHWKMNPIESRLNYKLPAVFSFSGDYVISTYHFQKWEYFLMNPQSFLNNTLVIPFSIVKLSYVGGLRILWDVIDWYYWEPPRSLKNKESCHIIMPFNCEIYHSTPFWALKKTICILFNYVVIPNTFHTKRLFQNVEKEFSIAHNHTSIETKISMFHL